MNHVLIGPSGCGKSTLLKVLCGIHTDFDGEIASRREGMRIGYVPQHYGLLEWKTLRANIELPWRLGPAAARRALPPREDREREAEAVIHALGLPDALDRYPREVSGGQRQRAALARAFVLAPDILLMDEPFSALDAFTAETCRDLFLALWKERPVTTLLVTHSMREAVRLGEKVLVMGGKGGLPGVVENESFGTDDEDARMNVIGVLSAMLREAS